MKPLILCIALLVAVGMALPAHAQSGAAPRGHVSGFGSFALSASPGLERGHGGGLSGGYFFSEMIGVEGSFTLRTFDVSSTSDNELSGGELTSNLVSVNVVARFDAGSVQPYVSGGVSFFMNDYTIDPATDAALKEFNFTHNESVDDTVGFNFGGGVDFRFSGRIGAFVEGRYSLGSADTTGGLTDDISGVAATSVGRLDLGTFAVNGGVRILF